jgi:hypothetical protein
MLSAAPVLFWGAKEFAISCCARNHCFGRMAPRQGAAYWSAHGKVLRAADDPAADDPGGHENETLTR